MLWFKRDPASATCALFGTIPPVPAQGAVQLEQIRDMMLASIEAADCDRFPSVVRRIRFAGDVEALWFLRGDLMALLASRRGESAALATLDGISEVFEDLLPAGLRSRPRPLSSQPRR